MIYEKDEEEEEECVAGSLSYPFPINTSTDLTIRTTKFRHRGFFVFLLKISFFLHSNPSPTRIDKPSAGKVSIKLMLKTFTKRIFFLFQVVLVIWMTKKKNIPLMAEFQIREFFQGPIENWRWWSESFEAPKALSLVYL